MNHFRAVFLSFSLLFMLCFSNEAWAGTALTGDYLTDISTKFGRGLKNLVISPGEIPCGVVDDTQEHKFWGVFSGIGKGTVFMLRRILVGVDEIITFVIPMEATLPPLCQVDAAAS